MIFTSKKDNPLAIEQYEIDVENGQAFEAAYDKCQEIISRSCLEDSFLSCK